MKVKMLISVITIYAFSFFVSVSFGQDAYSDTSGSYNKRLSDQKRLDSLKNESERAKQVKRNASDASDETNKALKAEKRAQKARQQADEQNRKATKTKEKSDND